MKLYSNLCLGNVMVLSNTIINVFILINGICFVFRKSLICHLPSNMVDYIPIISQVKSAVQAICGDEEGARKTQHKFTKSFPGISQVRGVVELAMGREEEAIDTFKAGGAFLDGIPVVGHVKGVVHYACGDKEGGDAAMISSSRTTGVIGGSVGGFLVGGPVGAAAGGVAAGALMDSVTTVVDSAVHGETRTHGAINAVEQICDDPKDVWRYADLVAIPATDAMAGYKTGKGIAKAKPGATPVKALKKVAKKPHKAAKIVKEASEIEERETRHERKLHSLDIDEDDSEEVEDDANVSAVVRLMHM